MREIVIIETNDVMVWLPINHNQFVYSGSTEVRETQNTLSNVCMYFPSHQGLSFTVREFLLYSPF